MNGAGEAVDLYISGPVSRLSLNILKSLQKDRPWLCLSRCYPPPLSNEWCKLQRRPGPAPHLHLLSGLSRPPSPASSTLRINSANPANPANPAVLNCAN